MHGCVAKKNWSADLKKVDEFYAQRSVAIDTTEEDFCILYFYLAYRFPKSCYCLDLFLDWINSTQIVKYFVEMKYQRWIIITLLQYHPGIHCAVGGAHAFRNALPVWDLTLYTCGN